MNDEEDVISKTDFENYFTISDPTTTYIRRFRMTGHDFKVKFNNLDKGNLYKLLPKLLDRVLDKVLSQVDQRALIGVVFQHPRLSTPVLVYFRPRENLTGNIICDTITQVVQSNQGIEIESDPASFHITTIVPPSGSGLHSTTRYRLHDNIIKK